MPGQAHGGLRRQAREAVHLLDATHVPLHALARAWAPDKRRGGAGAKLHVDLDAEAGVPVHFDVTPVRINDITVAKAMILRPGATYVFDLGYYDFAWWRALNDAGCRFVTPLKSHTRPTLVATRPLAAGSAIVADRIVCLDGRLKTSRASPLAGLALREIEVVIESGKRLRILSNDPTPRPRPSPPSTRNAGRSNCSSSGSSRTSRSSASSAPPRMPCAPRSPWR